MAVPLVVVLVLAFMGTQTFICLFAGLFFAYAFGMMAGTVTSTMDYLNMMMGGFASAGGWVIVMMMWVAAFGGIMKSMNAFEPVSKLLSKINKFSFINSSMLLIIRPSIIKINRID